ncbi:MAG TPA: N-acetylglucosamine kinase [Balneola sp.]|jgi:N-acetylglucosamine kinase-like BadF-type ATPase|nr:N-acetylglucosamine kinase [Balneola sp.]MBF63788.1 N-acetylglucosamine kinase [Balneola sp.]HAW80258.1 N-acetylglucosamine kinase [Balneola sp.]HBZ39395.1 N-acetylglucosamine kinase [Balneola sp.]HCT53556.1 N-acetylglucosamine kinase [Balneola sp.]|tara:strand:- start:3471 stop:4310 length:840 start_codon:yes stop_codon:yes gene_type:complete
MSILIADSGSTKTEWVLIQNGEKEYFNSDGLNPYFRTHGQLSEAIKNGVKSSLKNSKIDKIHFYGSGSGNASRKAILQNAIRENFPDSEIFIESDMLGAAIACFGNNEGVACILGTGSNSCLYDGEKIVKSIPSLGFVFGDEGSGGYFGKRILNAYYYKTMPEDLRNALEETSDMSLESVLHKIYEEPQANRFVASFSKILGDYRDHPFIKDMVRRGFEAFADKQLGYFEESKQKEIGFVGSIASVYKDILEDVLVKRGMNLAVVVRKPLENLVDFHNS